jgi:hypothetical protein
LIRTLTYLRCDRCPAELAGCDCLGFENRELNALATAREEGWHRLAMGDHALDLCLECYAAAVLAGPDPITTETRREREATPSWDVGSRV